MTSSSLVIGGSGFIGQTLCRHLLASGHPFVILDRVPPPHVGETSRFIQGDAADVKFLDSVVGSYMPSVIYHLAANSDIATGSTDASLDFGDTLGCSLAIRQVLERRIVQQLVFASSSAVFGASSKLLTENSQDLKHPISWYGRAKLASEFVFESLSLKQPNLSVLIARFPNVVGGWATHGVVFDFIRKLIDNPARLEVLGNGNQSKPYIHSTELIRAVEHLRSQISTGVSYFNIGPEDALSVREIAQMVCDALALNPTMSFGEEPFGWPGDVPQYGFETAMLKQSGFRVRFTSKEAVQKAIQELVEELSQRE